MLKKIVTIGPESTGKSTLCEMLALHYNTEWCPEYAREYLLKHGMDYSFDDLLNIAKRQIDLEEKFTENFAGWQSAVGSRQSNLVFVDTDMYVMKVWCEFVFGKCHQWILDRIVDRKYDLYLLCNIDLPWTKDELREYPDPATRRKLYHIYKDIMINQSVPWVEISGNYDERLAKSIEAVNQIL